MFRGNICGMLLENKLGIFLGQTGLSPFRERSWDAEERMGRGKDNSLLKVQLGFKRHCGMLCIKHVLSLSINVKKIM